MNNATVTKLISLLKPYGVKRIGIFGSFARGDFNKNSDIDVLVDFRERKSLLEIVHIENEISETLGRKIDLLTEKAISPYLIDRIMNETRVVYDEKG